MVSQKIVDFCARLSRLNIWKRFILFFNLARIETRLGNVGKYLNFKNFTNANAYMSDDAG